MLPKGMTGCFAFMMVLGTILGWIGDHTPVIRSYLGGGAIVCIFGSALLRVILKAQKAMEGKGGIVIRNANRLVRTVFSVTGFDDVLHFE